VGNSKTNTGLSIEVDDEECPPGHARVVFKLADGRRHAFALFEKGRDALAFAHGFSAAVEMHGMAAELQRQVDLDELRQIVARTGLGFTVLEGKA
jgi:hypothetical protein